MILMNISVTISKVFACDYYFLCSKIRGIIVLTVFLLPEPSFSQTTPDTLEQARSLRDNGKIGKSMTLLSAYYKTHPDDLNTTWLYAQTAYWGHRTSLASTLYQKAIELSPENKELQLDYAKMLVNTGDFAKADQLLKRYTSDDISNPEAWFYFAKIDY